MCCFVRKKLKGTCDYIYQTLFLDGEGSDVTIEALGKQISHLSLLDSIHYRHTWSTSNSQIDRHSRLNYTQL